LELQKGDTGYYRQERRKGRSPESIRREYYPEGSPAAIAYDAKMQKEVDKAQGLTIDIDPELEAEAKRIAEDQEALVMGVTADTEKNNILAKTFKLGELKPRHHKVGYAGMYGMGQAMSTFKTDEDYENYLREQLGNKYDRYKELQGIASLFDTTLNKDNIGRYATLEDADANTQAEVIYEAQKSAAEIALRDVDEDIQDLAEFYTGSEAVQKKKKQAYNQAVEKAQQDQAKYFELTGKTLVEKKTINGVTYDPVPNLESVLDKVEKQNQIELGRRLEEFEKNKVNVNASIESLEAIQKQMKEYATVDYDAPEQLAIRNNLIQQEEALLSKVNAQIVILNAESTALTNEIEKAGVAGITDAALVKSYKTMDKLANVWDQAFIGSSKMLVGGIARAFGDEETYNAAVDYNQKLQEYSEKYLPGNLTLDDDSTAWQYAGDMLVNNSPSIAVALATAGYGSVAGAAGGAVARAAATRTASRYATGVFFTMEAGGQLSNLEIAQRNAPEIIASLKEELKSAEEAGAAVADINKIKSQIQDQEDLLSLGMFQKGFNSIIYGGIAAGAERIGTLGFINNFQKYSRSVGGNQFRKLFGDAVGSRVAKNVGLLNATGIGAGIENLEEGMTLIGQNASDNIIFQPTNPKSLIEGLDGEFVRNTLVTSLAISGPSVSQNIYSQVANTVKTRKQNRKEAEIRDQLINIQAELGTLDGRTAEARALKFERDRLINEAAIENTEVMLNLKDLTGSEIETVFENDAEIRRLKLEARDLDITDFSPRAKKEFERLNKKAQELFNANQELLSRGETNIEKFAKSTANPVEAEVNARTYNTFKYIAENNPGINSIIIKDRAEAAAYADQAFKDDEAAKNKFLESYGTSNASFELNGDQLIYEEVVLAQIKEGGINARIAAVSPLHEIGHQQVVAAGLIKNDKLAVDSANELVQNLLQDVQVRFEQGKITQEEMDVFNERMSYYTEQGKGKYTETNGVDADELIQLIGDFTAIGILPKSSYGNLFGAKTFINNLLKKFNGDMAPLFKVNSTNDVYAFVANFQNKAAGFQIKKGIAGSGITKQQISSAAAKSNARVNLITKDELAGPRAQSVLFEEITNMVAAQIASKYTLPPQALEDFTAEVVGRIYLAKENTKWDGRGQLSGYLGGRISFRIADVVKAEYKLAPQERQFLGTIENLQPEDQKTLTVQEESAPVVKEKPKYRNLLQSKVLPSEAAAKVKQKVLSVTRVLKSRIDAAVSLNRTVTPLIAEIKKEIGKQADIEFKKMLGSKKDGELRRNLLKLKKPILENMTTTWLMQAMPFAVQKQVDGKFTSDWQGKKIDRETVDTDKAGRTSGAEIVRRKPNAANTVSDADFLGYMFKGNDVIRGRKEALAKAMAEEYAFDLYNQELQEPSSELRQALEANQTRLGVELSENLAQEFLRQAERGSAKRSVARLGLSDFQKWNAGKDQFFSELKALLNSNGTIKENAIKKAHKNIYPDFTDAQHTAISKQFFRLLKPLKDIEVETAFKEEGKTFEEYLADIARDIDANETIAKMTGVEGSIASLFENYNNVMDAQTAVEKVLKTLDIQTAVAFTSTSFANSGRIGLWVDGELDFSKTHRSDLYAGQEQVIEALNRAGFNIKSISPTKITLKDGTILGREYSATGNVLKGHLTGKFDSNADKANANAAWKYTTAMIKGIKNSTPEVQAMVMASLNSGTNTALRAAAPVTYRSSVLPSQITKDYRYEHGVQARVVLAHLYQSIIKGDNSIDIKALKADYQVAIIPVEMDKVIGKSGYQQVMIAGYIPGETPWWKRYYNFATRGKVQYALESLIDGSIIGQQYADYFNQKGVKPEVKPNAALELNEITTQQKALNNARKQSYAAKPKGISVYDFDDTLAFSKSQVIVKMPADKPMLDIAARRLYGETALKNKPGFLKTFSSLNEEQQTKVLEDVPGATRRITPAEFAKDSEKLASQGATFDFSEFNKVIEGTPGPLAPRLKKAIEKFGNKNIFVLTARPAESANAIHAFLKGIGLEIPLENITGLANGAPAAKAAWMVGKVSEGYNDFYFVDDHMGNVKAVKDVLNTFDVKGKVQQARVKRSAALSKELNKMIERNKGIASEAVYSKIRARKEGAKKGRFKFFLPYGAEDFRGLTSYTLAGKGKQGEADQKFFEDNLVVPYMRGIAAMEKARRALKNDFAGLLKMFPGIKKRLGKKIGDTDYTVDQAVRVYLWTKQGQEVPGISKRDQKKLNSLVAKDPNLSAFADGLETISKQDQWPAPSEHWIAGSVLKDINEINEVLTRGEYLQEFNDNVDIIFDENNLTKLEAIYGTRYVNALKNSIARMKSGRNRPAQPGAYEQQWLNWVNNSVGTIMFFNRRSAMMQMLSFANFVNWSDNNPLKAGIAFANQPAYWSAWSKIFNSDKLKERRGGLKSDVQEQEIANQAKNSKDKASAVIAYLLKIGFTPTQIADSFAIATGGATFLINRTKTYKKQGLSQAEAEAKAFEDFSAISDETQQSGDPMLVSAQQASHLGRLVLAFQNTPMQYTRLMKKAAQDLINGRGDAKTNISKILYYGFVQNLIFSALQNALFALIPGFDDEEEDDEKYEKVINTKTERIVNSMVDTILRGSGLTGAVVSTIKNTINRYYKEEKKGFTADHAYTLLELANVSPPIGSKLRKVYGAIQTKKFDRDVISAQGYDVTLNGRFNISPNYEIIGSLASAGLNLPLDRALAEVDAIAEMLDARNTSYQRLALGLGWRTWDVNAKKEEEELAKMAGRMQRSIEGKKKAKATREKKRQEELDRLAAMTPAEKQKYIDDLKRKRSEAAKKAVETRRINKRKKDSILSLSN
jgi:hypothetical protein